MEVFADAPTVGSASRACAGVLSRVIQKAAEAAAVTPIIVVPAVVAAAEAVVLPLRSEETAVRLVPYATFFLHQRAPL